MRKILLICIMGLLFLTGCSKKEEQYENVTVSKEELPVYFKQNGKYGFIDKNGNVVIEPKFTKTYGFSSDGTAAVSEGGFVFGVLTDKWGMINTKGEYIIKPEFSFLG